MPSKEGTSITGMFYKNTVLNKIKYMYRKKRPSVGLQDSCLLHDNSPSYKSREVVDFLSKQKVNVLNHPPYTSDLSPYTFVLCGCTCNTTLVAKANTTLFKILFHVSS